MAEEKKSKTFGIVVAIIIIALLVIGTIANQHEKSVAKAQAKTAVTASKDASTHKTKELKATNDTSKATTSVDKTVAKTEAKDTTNN